MSIVVDVGLLLIGVKFEFEEVLLGMEEGGGFEFRSVNVTRVDGSGMIILVPR